MTTATLIYDRKRKSANGGEGKIEIRITENRKSYYFSTGIKVRREQWEFDTVVYHPAADELNKRISILLRKIMQEANAMLESGRNIDVMEIRRKVSEGNGEKTLIEWIATEIPLLNLSAGTKKHYMSFLHRLTEWGCMNAWKDVTVENIYKWDAWLRRLPGRCEKITGGGVYNYHKCMRSMLGRAERSGLLQSNPYHVLRGAFSKVDRENTEYLTEDEMQLIMKFSPAPGSFMEKARDLFIFQMFTGLSYSDTQAFDISAYKKIDGKWRIVGSRIKTGQPFVNQLLPPAVEVLERYGMKVPKMTNQVYNRELKLVGQAAGITFPLHSHLARHTFATYMLRNGVKIENLAKMLGHANIKQTQRYAKVLAESVHEEFDMIAAKISTEKR